MKRIVLTMLAILGISLLILNVFQNIGAKDTQAIAADDEELATKLDRLNPENGDVSYVDYLHHWALTHDQVTIAVIGSSVTNGKGASVEAKNWPSLMLASIQQTDEDLLSSHVLNYGVNGATIDNLLQNGRFDQLIKDMPDFVIIESSILNSHRKNETLDESNQAIKTAVELVQEALPTSKILLSSPNPATIKLDTDYNEIGLVYQEYLESTENYILSHGWNYVDIYTAMMDEIEEQDLTLDMTLDDGLHPNDLGYQIWADKLMIYLNKDRSL
ncbi:SGNH/GDSL hydrolase family protein [Alkalicoccobacillus murimartini]|uniref:Lysophospholipase L1-like esterase n=1 Tax=Alkalicoccobacillus murimartini TaxID=171685 RepID=A0ABT9YGR2_9BACI|nr:SGNH/GDSL hydrolase family protein [Alkalicoccobacillus murimartini]MDQ0206889.1 lysophospholipase L1-like esterase [Alkalicoccobacillus murimartini]